MTTVHDLREAIMEGAVQRVRPKMMTVAAIMGGLLPIMWTTGTGADVMKRIAAPMIGGMVSSTVLTLLVIPILYALWRSRSIHAVDHSWMCPLITWLNRSSCKGVGLRRGSIERSPWKPEASDSYPHRLST